jgi:hypothetical protein
MNCANDGSSFAGQLLEQRNTLKTRGRIEAGGRLVKKHDWRIVYLNEFIMKILFLHLRSFLNDVKKFMIHPPQVYFEGFDYRLKIQRL